MRVTFAVPLVAGKARPRVTRQGHAYTPSATREAEALVRREWCRVAGGAHAMPHVPVTVEVTTERPMPGSRPRHMASEPDTFRPDVDNDCKLVLDALNGVAWADDAQVTCLVARKLDRTRDTRERTAVTVSWEE